MNFDKNLSFGMVPFETLYFYDYKIEDIDKHYVRLKRTHRILNISFNIGYQNFYDMLYKYIYENNLSSGVLKVVCYNDEINIFYRKPHYTKDMFQRGLKLKISKVVKSKRNIFNYIKTFNYGINYIEDIKAKKKGYDTALFLNENKEVCETSYANIFFVYDKEIFTPHLLSGILRGIMRDNVLSFFKSKGYKINKTFIRYEDIKYFKECFLTNSVMGVMPVFSIDDILFKERYSIDLILKSKKFFREWIK
ncbi:4-amino-4-deoxychorismate lyase [Caloramator fervidus]|uniref:4-amino-4-deoxychorismate lyase n=1 Tax=Caloramator fervidus TaxID=29344 RepID=A0A1H5SQ07_9CLOT|nr:aminotransferase class IV [Caloramator fervidus]SEF52524.1 4-amino-4-deoxychorismate lyase [Caloramator fervidus]